MSEKEILIASALTAAVLFSVLTLFLIGDLLTVALAALGVHLIVRRIETQRARETAPEQVREPASK